MWLGGLLNPEAFITATRQAAAQSHGWSLENLRLHAEAITLKSPSDTSSSSTLSTPDADGFTVRGLSLEGASWDKSALALTDELSVSLAPIRFLWKNQEDSKTQQTQQTGQINVPVYLSETRTELLFAIDLAIPPTPPVQSWYQKSVAIISWKPEV